MRISQYFLSVLFGIASGIGPYETALADGVDDFDQVSLVEAAQGDPAMLTSLSSQLKLSAAVNVGNALDGGTLASQIKALQPLISPKQIPAAGAPPGLTEDQKAFIADATKWVPNNSDPKSGVFVTPQGRINIRVCWLDFDEADPVVIRARNLVQISISSTWEYHGNVSFVGWKKCQSDARGIKIRISDTRPESKIGNISDTIWPSMVLNFTFNDSQMAGCQTKKDLCIHSIAVHEFGHALGFLHEQDSPEIPKWCKRQLPAGSISKPLESLNAKMLTDWDKFSVMDYCFDIYSTRIQLSDCDIAAIHAAYQVPDPVRYKPKCPVRKNL